MQVAGDGGAHITRACSVMSPLAQQQLSRIHASVQVAIMQGVPDAVLVTFDGCGHLALFQEVEMFAALVDAFTAASGRFEPGPEYKCNAGAV